VFYLACEHGQEASAPRNRPVVVGVDGSRGTRGSTCPVALVPVGCTMSDIGQFVRDPARVAS